MVGVTRILLESDDYSPNSKPHALAALHWPELFIAELKNRGPKQVEDLLRSSGWDPQWRFSMYSQAHYHTTTHELLVVIKDSATIQLGGSDERARPKNATMPSQSCTTLHLQLGDALLLPAGYTHRLVEGGDSFTMIGAYPKGSVKWDMRFPNVMGCPHDVENIQTMVGNSQRKGLLGACSPEMALQQGGTMQGEIEQHWNL